MADKPQVKLIDWPRCKTCKHWASFAHNSWGRCWHPEMYFNQDTPSDPDEVHGDRSQQDIATGPEFGVHHEEKQ